MWCCCRRQRWSLGGSEVLSFEGDEGEGSGQLRGRFFRQYPAPPNGPKEDHKEKKVKDSEWKKALEIEGIDEENPPWVEHSAFESTVGAVILLSTICTGLEIDLHEQSDPTIWIIIENFFCVVWITEMVAKLWELRCRYFQDCLNYVDMSLVVLSVFDAWIMPFLVDYGGDLVLFRLVRLVRLLRLVKLLQVLRRFRNLWLMVRGLIESVSTLNWVILMLCLVMYIFAVFLRLAVDCKGLFADWDPECDQYFGTIPKIMYTLVQVLTLESWAMTVGRPLVDRQPLLFIILLLFIFLTTFGLLNIIVGVIVENTLNIAQSDQELQDRRLQRQLLHELEFLRQVFETADFDGSGTLDREEFVEICQRHEVKTALLRMEIPAEQPEELFDILDEDNLGQITFLQFHESVKKVRGVPTAFDMKNMMVSVSDILRRQNRLQTQYERTEQIIYAIFGKTPPARTQGRLTSMDMQDAANIALLQRKSGFAARAQLKRGGSMESMESCFTYATESLGRPASAASPKSMRAEDAFDIGPGLHYPSEA
ncbi:unnamed protein product [Durusdinium trenchii]|uniref:EF-hand domain-containing protein n=2 Tax=Durusdinium trenchii TaxID=1381693 RepID=A0ABP0QFY1_9DINO